MDLPNFIGGSYQSQSPLADQEITFNWYVENTQSKGASTPAYFCPTPGVTQLGAAPTGSGLAHIYAFSREFAVIGTTFWEIDQFGTFINRGTVAVSSTPATISSNGNAGGQLLITAGTNAYIFTVATNAFAQVAAMDGRCTMGDQMDGYFLILDSSTSTFYYSALNDGTSWSPTTDFNQRGIAPDPWVSLKVANKYIWLFGSETSELWYDAGTSPNPFAPYPTSLIPYGCVAPFSPVVADGTLEWLGGNKQGNNQFLRAGGSQPEVISTYALENTLASYSVTSDAIGDSYSDLGHTFYLTSFPSANSTLCFDSDTSLWHNRGTWISEQNQYVVWRPRFHALAFGQHRMLDANTGAVYQMSSTVSTDVDARPIRNMRRSPALYSQNERVFLDSFELDMEIGLGNTVDPGSDPQVMMRMSPDGGKTWGSEHWRSGGKIGEYKKRVRWNRCGQARRRVFEVAVTDAIKWRVLGAFVKVRGQQQQAAANG